MGHVPQGAISEKLILSKRPPYCKVRISFLSLSEENLYRRDLILVLPSVSRPISCIVTKTNDNRNLSKSNNCSFSGAQFAHSPCRNLAPLSAVQLIRISLNLVHKSQPWAPALLISAYDLWCSIISPILELGIIFHCLLVNLVQTSQSAIIKNK